MRKRTSILALGFVWLLVWVVLLTAAISLLRRWHPFDQDYSELPPKLAFERVFRRSVPPGLMDIKAAGHAWTAGRDIWMRFRATDAAVKLLTNGSKPFSPESSFCIDTSRLQEAAPRQVHWEDVLRIRDPRCYNIDPPPNQTGCITLIPDRQRHLVYVYLHDI